MEATTARAPTAAPPAKKGMTERARAERKLAWLLCAPAVIVMRKKRCVALAPSALAASCSSSGTSASPAKSSSAMKGVVFHTSAAMITNSDPAFVVRGAQVSGTRGRPNTNPLVGSNAYRHANAATTVTMPYGMRIAARTGPRPKIARCMTSAISMPSTSSIETEITVMITVVRTSDHQVLELSTSA